MRPTPKERGRACAAKMALSAQGQDGSKDLMRIVRALRWGLALSPEDTLEILTDVFNPRCEPPWPQRELRRAARNAPKARGYQLGYMLDPSDRPVADQFRAQLGPGPVATAPVQLDEARHDGMMCLLAELCRGAADADDGAVDDYLRRQRRLGASVAPAGVFWLPPQDAQQRIVDVMRGRFEDEELYAGGLLRRYPDGSFETRWFRWPRHRLALPWKTIAGRVDVLQRRKLDNGTATPRYVMPIGRRPSMPFGAEQLRADDVSKELAFVEGALDTLALREIAAVERLRLTVLGLPSADGWRAQWAQFARGRVAKVGLDADAKGDAAAARLVADLRRAGAVEVLRWRPAFPDSHAHDWGEILEERA